MSIVFLDPQNQEVCGYNFTLPKGRGTRLALSAKPDKRLKVFNQMLRFCGMRQDLKSNLVYKQVSLIIGPILSDMI
ncbi:hypothetical protein DEO72_LG1g2360 [Vigna unguiculata]|uniref:Uncharacterized protein n=1 Tax=Vigna unguiculata TaxID=3917 RepID=A0A4D6KY30_VIGUN|nr:hypothetical protein DEO72_LG1g2360 [Vigna unguiculata]